MGKKTPRSLRAYLITATSLRQSSKFLLVINGGACFRTRLRREGHAAFLEWPRPVPVRGAVRNLGVAYWRNGSIEPANLGVSGLVLLGLRGRSAFSNGIFHMFRAAFTDRVGTQFHSRAWLAVPRLRIHAMYLEHSNFIVRVVEPKVAAASRCDAFFSWAMSWVSPREL